MDHAAVLDLRDVGQTVVAALAPFAHAKGVDLALEQPTTPVFARANTEAVEIALSNLIENAILHDGAGAVEVTVDHGPAITVRHHGPGLPPVEEEQIFKPFWRGPHAVSGGAGLGLAIVDRAQRAQGGGVFVKTPEADGATFVLTYPSAD